MLSWSVAGQFSRYALQFVANVIISQRLGPEVFGVATLALAAVAIASILTELGVLQWVVQENELTDDSLSTAFWINALTGVPLAALMILVSPVIAGFFDTPELAPLVQLAALNFVLAVGVVQQGLLERTQRFARAAKNDVAGGVVGSTLAVLGAVVLDLGAVALVVGPLIGTGVRTLLYWQSVSWRPSFRWGKQHAAEVWRYGRGVVVAAGVTQVTQSIDSALLGRFMGLAPVGLYGRALSMTNVPDLLIGGSLGRLLLPALSRMKSAPALVRGNWSRAFDLAVNGAMAIALAASLLAFVVVDLLYPPAWAEVASVLVLLTWLLPFRVGRRTAESLIFALGMTERAPRTIALAGRFPRSGCGIGNPVRDSWRCHRSRGSLCARHGERDRENPAPYRQRCRLRQLCPKRLGRGRELDYRAWRVGRPSDEVASPSR